MSHQENSLLNSAWLSWGNIVEMTGEKLWNIEAWPPLMRELKLRGGEKGKWWIVTDVVGRKPSSQTRNGSTSRRMTKYGNTILNKNAWSFSKIIFIFLILIFAGFQYFEGKQPILTRVPSHWKVKGCAQTKSCLYVVHSVTAEMNNAHIHCWFMSCIAISLTSIKLHRVRVNAKFGPTRLKMERLLRSHLTRAASQPLIDKDWQLYYWYCS